MAGSNTIPEIKTLNRIQKNISYSSVSDTKAVITEFSLNENQGVQRKEYVNPEAGELEQANTDQEITSETGQFFVTVDPDNPGSYNYRSHARVELENDVLINQINGEKIKSINVADGAHTSDTVDISDLVETDLSAFKVSEQRPTENAAVSGTIEPNKALLSGSSIGMRVGNMAGRNISNNIIAPSEDLRQGIRVTFDTGDGAPTILQYREAPRTHIFSQEYNLYGANSINGQLNNGEIGNVVVTVGGVAKTFINSNNPGDLNFKDVAGLFKAIAAQLPVIVDSSSVPGAYSIAPKDPKLGIQFAGDANKLGLIDLPEQLAGEPARFFTLDHIISQIRSNPKLNAQFIDSAGDPLDGLNRAGKTVKELEIYLKNCMNQATVRIEDVDIAGVAANSSARTARQVMVTSTEEAIQQLRIIAPKHGLKEGDWVKVENLVTSQVFLNAALGNGVFNVMSVDNNSFTISVNIQNGDAVAAIAYINANNIDRRPKQVFAENAASMTFRKIAGENVANPILRSTQVESLANRTIRITFGGAPGLAQNDRVKITGLGSIAGLQAGDLAPDGIYQVARVGLVGGNNIEIIVPDIRVIAAAVNANITVQKVGTGDIRVARNNNADLRIINIYQKDALMNYKVGDVVEFKGLAVAGVDVGGGGANVFNGFYKVVGSGNDAEGGDYFSIRVVRPAAGDGFSNVLGGRGGDFGVNFRINNISAEQRALGIRSDTGAVADDGAIQMDIAYDPEGNRAPNLSGTGINAKLKSRIDRAKVSKKSTIIDARGNSRELTMNLVMLNENQVSVELKIERNKFGRYDVVGVSEDSQGKLVSGILTLNNDTGTILNVDKELMELPITWKASDGSDMGSTNIKMNYDHLTFKHKIGGITNSMEITQDGKAASDMKEVKIDDKGTVVVHYMNGDTRAVYKLARAKINGWEHGIQTDGSIKLKQGVQEPIYNSVGKVFVGMTPGSNVNKTREMVEMQKMYNMVQNKNVANLFVNRTEQDIIQNAKSIAAA